MPLSIGEEKKFIPVGSSTVREVTVMADLLNGGYPCILEQNVNGDRLPLAFDL
jgi:hypothetical protein